MLRLSTVNSFKTFTASYKWCRKTHDGLKI